MMFGIRRHVVMVWISVVLLSSCSFVFGRKSKSRQQWVSYRLMAFNAGSAANIPLGPRQIGQIAEMIIDNSVDIAGVTELEQGTIWHDGRNLVAELKGALVQRGYPMYVYTWRQMRIAGGWFTPALFSRFSIEESGCDFVGSYSNWCTGHITVNVADKTPVRVYMTHIWPRGEPNAINQGVKELVSFPDKWKGPGTIMGDFNLGPESTYFKTIMSLGWGSSCHVLYGRDCFTVGGSCCVTGPMPLSGQIDYIFGNRGIGFVDSYVGYYSNSDHWPVFAEVRVKANGPPVKMATRKSKSAQSTSSKARARASGLYRKHDYVKAAQAYRAWAKSCKNKDEAGFAAYSEACMCLLAGRPDQAANGFVRVIGTYPKTEWSTRAHLQLGLIHKEAKQWPVAEQEFLAYLEGYYLFVHADDPKVPAVTIVAKQLAECRTAQGRKTNHKVILEEFIQGHPLPIIARSAACCIGEKKLMQGDYKGALPYLLKAAPKPMGAHGAKAQRYIEMFKQAGRNDLAKPFEDYCAKWNRH
ncbi:MAG: endonuclease/exonuclease/phosphatase family protein [Planctomycetota bacterium]|jgi:endonuclease/exonuclease/phosphatase family metal-dependent hydrolase